MLDKPKKGKPRLPTFEIQKVSQVVSGGLTNMYEVRFIMRRGKSGRPKVDTTLCFAKDELEAFQRGLSVITRALEEGLTEKEQT